MTPEQTHLCALFQTLNKDQKADSVYPPESASFLCLLI